MEHYSVPRLKSVEISSVDVFHERPIVTSVRFTNTENKVCRAELGRYPLSIDIKASLLCYWQRLGQKSDNHARNLSQFFDLLSSDETIQMHYIKKPAMC